MNRLSILGVVALAPFVFSCGSDSPAGDAGADTGGGTDSGGGMDASKPDTGGGDSGGGDSGGGDSGGMDAGPDVDAGFMLNGCTDMNFVDRSNGGNGNRTVTWDLQQNFPMCFQIKTGQQFTWNGALATHPLQPAGGSMGSPIMTTNMGNSVNFNFPNVGDYGFNCQVHPGTMRGVIRVRP